MKGIKEEGYDGIITLLSPTIVFENKLLNDELAKWTIPFWFDRIAVGNGLSLAEAVFKESDEIIIMAYRNQLTGQDDLLKHIENERKWTEAYKTSLIVAVETRKSENEKISFYGKGKDHFQSTIRNLQEVLKDEKYIEGISIHYLDTWKELIGTR